jgi:hypothetical protein
MVKEKRYWTGYLPWKRFLSGLMPGADWGLVSASFARSSWNCFKSVITA